MLFSSHVYIITILSNFACVCISVHVCERDRERDRERERERERGGEGVYVEGRGEAGKEGDTWP